MEDLPSEILVRIFRLCFHRGSYHPALLCPALKLRGCSKTFHVLVNFVLKTEGLKCCRLLNMYLKTDCGKKRNVMKKYLTAVPRLPLYVELLSLPQVTSIDALASCHTVNLFKLSR